MRQIVVRQPGAVEALELIDAPMPTPGPDEVLIKTAAMGVSRPDTLIRKGIYEWMPPLPASPGNELTGVVEAAGADVRGIDVGQPVLLSARDLPVRGGCYTAYIAVPAAAVYPLDTNIDLAEAVVLPSYLVAYAMLNDLGLRGRITSIFINGASGSVGGALVELAKAEGLTVIGSAGSEQRAQYVRSLGADHVLDYRRDPIIERVLALTGGRGVDAVFDHVIGAGFPDLLHMLADFGTLVFFNIHASLPDRDVFEEMRRTSTKSAALRCFNMHSYDHHPARRRVLMTELIALLHARRIRPRIGLRLPLEQAGEAHRLLEDGAVSGKIILTP